MNNTKQIEIKGYSRPPYMYDYEGRGIPKSKVPRVIPMRHLPTCTCSTCKRKKDTND